MNNHQTNDRDPTSSEGTQPRSPVSFVKTKGTLVTGKFKDKQERIIETVADLQLAFEGAHSQSRGERHPPPGPLDSLARASSIFLRKMVIGDRNNAKTRLLSDDIVQAKSLRFQKIKRFSGCSRQLRITMSIKGGELTLQKLDETTMTPESSVTLPMNSQTLNLNIQWPLPGTVGWNDAPTKDCPWYVRPDELIDLDDEGTLDCSGWLAQQLVMFDHRGITLKDLITMVATYEGAHSINVSRMLQAHDQNNKGAFDHVERHILDNITIFGCKYSHIVVIECALYLYEKLIDEGHVEKPAMEKWRFRPSFGTLDDEESFFIESRKWLAFSGGMVVSFGNGEFSLNHTIRAVGK